LAGDNYLCAGQVDCHLLSQQSEKFGILIGYLLADSEDAFTAIMRLKHFGRSVGHTLDGVCGEWVGLFDSGRD